MHNMGKLIEGGDFFGKKNNKEEKPKPKGNRSVSPMGKQREGKVGKEFLHSGSGASLSMAEQLEEVVGLRFKSEEERPTEIKEMLRMARLSSKIEIYIGGLADIPYMSNDGLAVIEKKWKQKTVSELLTAAENSNQNDWSTHPRNYLELARVLRGKTLDLVSTSAWFS